MLNNWRCEAQAETFHEHEVAVPSGIPTVSEQGEGRALLEKLVQVKGGQTWRDGPLELLFNRGQ